MNLTEAKSLARRRSRKKRAGRGMGSGRGKTCGRGHKGARSRSGWSERGMSGGVMPLFRRLPKVGFSNARFEKRYAIINVGRLCIFDEHAHVTPEELHRRGIVKQLKPGGVKILGDGELDRPLRVRAHAFSRSAREKIESAGGSVELIPAPRKPVRRKMKVSTPGEQGLPAVTQ